MTKIKFTIDSSDFDRKVEDFMMYRIPNAKRAILNVFADTAVQQAAIVCPKDTGNLRSTIRKQEIQGREEDVIALLAGGMRGRGGLSKTGKKVGSRFVNYALYVHEGTSKMSPRPFLTTGAQKAVAVADESKLKKAVFGDYSPNY